MYVHCRSGLKIVNKYKITELGDADLFCHTLELYHIKINSQGLVFGSSKLQLSGKIFDLFYHKNRKLQGYDSFEFPCSFFYLMEFCFYFHYFICR